MVFLGINFDSDSACEQYYSLERNSSLVLAGERFRTCGQDDIINDFSLIVNLINLLNIAVK